MTPQPVSVARSRADELSGDSSLVTGPLRGYHHETYVLLLPDGTGKVKIREPRAAILWFDRRCFVSEEELLRALHGQISRIPDLVDVDGLPLQRFIEGHTVGQGLRGGRRVPEAVFDQIVDLFGEMTRITSDMLWVQRRCEPWDRAEDGDCDAFLERLIRFSEEQVFQRNYPRFGGLFRELGVDERVFTRLRKHVCGLSERPFCLLHGDLHRENLLIDAGGRLWAIDWELAMIGDPLYDLATHLYLTHYPQDQERRMAREWSRIVERVRPGSSYAWEGDLPRILDFKKAQSVVTDVIRLSQSLVRDGAAFNWTGLPWAALKVQKVLDNGAGPLGLDQVPSHAQITGALVRWLREQYA